MRRAATPPARRRRDGSVRRRRGAARRRRRAHRSSLRRSRDQSCSSLADVCDGKPLHAPIAARTRFTGHRSPRSRQPGERRHPQALPENVHKRSHTLARGATHFPTPRRPSSENSGSPILTVGGKTEALPGRPRGAGLIHCVCGKCPDRQGTGATRVPLGYADLDRPGEVGGAFLFRW